MALNKLTDAACRNAKPVVRGSKDPNRPDDKLAPRLTKLSDGGGLMLWVEPSGAKRWRMAYRFAGNAKSLSFGSYPETSLSEAREARTAARKLLKDGVDPAQHKRSVRTSMAIAQANTFAVLASELLDKKRREGNAEATLKKLEWLLSLAMPLLGQRPIGEITAPEVLPVLKAVEDRGRHETAQKLRSVIGEVFRLAVSTGRAQGDPTVVLRGALTNHKVQHLAAIVEPRQFGQLLRAIDGYMGAPETKLGLQLLALVFTRPGELRQAEWSEFSLDVTEPVWVIPPAKTKMRREHRVPLAPQAVVILRELQTITGHGQFLFPSIRTSRRPMSENTLNAALRRLGYAKEEHTSHGFRSSASSLLNESKLFHPDAIERQLAHVDKSAVRRAYHRAEFWDERVAMMAWWSDLCDELRGGAANAKAA